MKYSRPLWLAIFFSSELSLAAPPPKEPTKKVSLIIGAWTVQLVPTDKRTVVFTFQADGKMLFDDGSGPVEEGSYTIDDKKNPPEIDYRTPARMGKNSGKPPFLGIYKLEKDTLTVYYSERERPTKFEAPRDSGIVEMVLTRSK